jgi:hypothetical protein
MIEIKYREGKEFLESLTKDDIRSIGEALVIEDQASGTSLLTLDYAIFKEELTKAGADRGDIKLGCIYIPECAAAGGHSVAYPEGVPFIMIHSFRARELEGEGGDDGAECGVPLLRAMIKDQLVEIGNFGYKHGQCDKCPHNTMEDDVKMSDKCFFQSKFVILTVIKSGETGELEAIPVQIKGKSVRAKATKTALITYTKKCGGLTHEYIGKLSSKEQSGKSKESKQEYIVHVPELTPDTHLSIDKEFLDVMREFRDSMARYYIIQHMTRTNRNTRLEQGATKAQLEDQNKDVKTLENKADEDDAAVVL